MTFPAPRVGLAVALAACLSLGLVACATPEAEQTPTPLATSPTPTAQAEEPEPEAEETPEPVGDPTCDTMISQTVIADFESIGWSSRAEPFYLGDREVPGGLLCAWADFEGPASDHLQLFGYAAVTAEQAAQGEASLISQGWMREVTDTGVYITENPETTIAADSDGYGMTYLFGDGWVKLADTKQGLLLIEWPPR